MDKPWEVEGCTDAELAEAYFNSWQSAHAAIAEKDREIERLQTNIDVMKRALRWSECEEDWDG